MNQTPLLADELTAAQRAALASLIQHPGWAVVEEMHMAACRRATEDVLKQDPGLEGAEKKIVALQLRDRERNEFSLLILGSVNWHAKALAVLEQEKEIKMDNPIIKGLK